MKKFVIAALVISGINIEAFEKTSTIKTNPNHLNSDAEFLEGKIIFGDKSTQTIVIKAIPAMKFPFADLHFKNNQIAFIALAKDTNGQNIHIFTHDAHHYINHVSIEQLDLWKREMAPELAKRNDSFAFILINPIRRSVNKESQLFNLKTKNGNSFPVSLDSSEIIVGDGLSDKVIFSADLISLINDNGLYVKSKNNNDYNDSQYDLVKDHYLSFSIPQSDCSFQMPWANVLKLDKENISKNISTYLSFLDAAEIPEKQSFSQEPETQNSSTNSVKTIKKLKTFRKNIIHNSQSIFSDSIVEVKEEFPVDFSNDSTNSKTQNFLIKYQEKPYNNASLKTDFKQEEESDVWDHDEEDDANHEEASHEDEDTYEDNEDDVTYEDEDDMSDQDDSIAGLSKTVVSADWDDSDQALQSILDIQEDIEARRLDDNSNDVAEAQIFLDQNSLNDEVVAFATTELTPENKRIITALHNTDEKSVISINFVTNAEYANFIKATGYHSPSEWKTHPPQANRPVVNISYIDALQYANWIGKKIPSKNELQNARENGIIASQTGLDEWTSTTPKQYYKTSQNAEVVQIPKTNYKMILSDRNSNAMRFDKSNNQTSFRVTEKQ